MNREPSLFASPRHSRAPRRSAATTKSTIPQNLGRTCSRNLGQLTLLGDLTLRWHLVAGIVWHRYEIV